MFGLGGKGNRALVGFGRGGGEGNVLPVANALGVIAGFIGAVDVDDNDGDPGGGDLRKLQD